MNAYVDDDNEIASEVQSTGISESQLGGTSRVGETENSEEKKSLSKKLSERIKQRVKNYIHNLDPRGKDKFWWAGSLLSTSASAATVLLYSKAMDVFSEEDIKSIEDCVSEEEANKYIARLYASKVGVTPQEL